MSTTYQLVVTAWPQLLATGPLIRHVIPFFGHLGGGVIHRHTPMSSRIEDEIVVISNLLL